MFHVLWGLRGWVGEGRAFMMRPAYADGVFAYPVGSLVRFHNRVEHSTTILLVSELSGGVWSKVTQ